MAEAYPMAAGVRSIGASTMQYIPELFSGKLQKKYRDALLLTQITNNDYQGEIKRFGDTVYIRSVPDMSVRRYYKGQTLVNDQPESVSQSLVIDQGYYWSFVSFDLDKAQSDLKNMINDWAAEGAIAIKVQVETDVLAGVIAGASAYNKGAAAGYKTAGLNLGTTGSALAVTRTDVLDLIVKARICMKELNVPSDKRFFLIPPHLAAVLTLSDLKAADMMGDDKSVLRTDYLGRLSTFDFYESNLLDTDGTYTQCLFGHKDAITFATQVTTSQMLPNPNGFGTLHRGLVVYGYKVVKPEALGVAVVAPSL